MLSFIHQALNEGIAIINNNGHENHLQGDLVHAINDVHQSMWSHVTHGLDIGAVTTGLVLIQSV